MLTSIMPAAGIVKDNSQYLSEGGYIDGDKVRFRGVAGKAMPEVIGGWEKKSTDTFIGKCRGAHEWQDNSGNTFVAFGTHRKLYVERSGRIWDITPISDGDLGTDPLSTTDGSSSVSVTDTAHGALAGAYAYLTGLSATGGLTIGGGSGSFASNPFTTASGSTIVRVTLASHGLSTNDLCTISSVGAAVNGIPTADLNKRHTVYVIDTSNFLIEVDTRATSSGAGGGTPSYVLWRGYPIQSVTDADTYVIDAGSNATSTASGGGSGGDVVYELNPGLENTTAQAGYGTGPYGSGVYGAGGDTVTSYRARVWAMDNLGEDLVCAPVGGSMYRWQGNRSQRAAVNAASDAPTQINWLLVTPERFLVVLGCNGGSAYDPLLVKWATQAGGFTSGDWTTAATNTAREQRLGAGSEIVAAAASPFVTVIWTDASMHQMRYLEDTTFVYGFDYVSDTGLIGPNAWAKDANTGGIIFLSKTWQFYAYGGGAAQVIPCPNRDWMRDKVINGVQETKIFASANALNSEIWFLFPGDSIECDTYLFFQTKEKVWSIGTFDRTAMLDARSAGYPIMFGTDGFVWLHDKGDSAQGDAFESYIEAAPQDIEDGQTLMDITGMVPDFLNLSGGGSFYLYARDKPNSTVEEFGPYTILPTTERIDVRVNGRQVGWKWVRNGAPNSWRLGKFRLDVQATGGSRP